MTRMTRALLIAATVLASTMTGATAANAEVSGDATTASANCWAVAFTPRAESSWSIVATNSASCTGPVYNVRPSVRLWQLKAGWYVAAETYAYWGTVCCSRYGYVDAWMHPLPSGACYSYITQATITWTYANGSPGQSTNYSPTVRLTPYGPC